MNWQSARIDTGRSAYGKANCGSYDQQAAIPQ